MTSSLDRKPLTVLCIATYLKGHEFLRECKRQGCRVFLLTEEKLREADWPRESIDARTVSSGIALLVPDHDMGGFLRRDELRAFVSQSAHVHSLEQSFART